MVGVVPYVALQLKAVSSAYAVMTGASTAHGTWWTDTTLYIALLLAGFTILFGTRHLDNTERHEGLVAAIAAESVVKLLAFIAVGVFAVGEIVMNLGETEERAVFTSKVTGLMPTKKDLKDSFWPIVRGTGIGAFLGVLPGIIGVMQPC